MDSIHSQKDRATAACLLVIQPSPDVLKMLHDDEFERDDELFVAPSSAKFKKSRAYEKAQGK